MITKNIEEAQSADIILDMTSKNKKLRKKLAGLLVELNYEVYRTFDGDLAYKEHNPFENITLRTEHNDIRGE